MLFDYNDTPHTRKHGPAGYENYQSFKPWLRDEFIFRCAYCLMRERWYPDGDASFSVEHFIPQAADPSLICRYDNLIYVCGRCNSFRRDIPVLDPCTIALSAHIRVTENGTIVGLTPEGVAHIEVLKLDDPILTEGRERLILTVRRFQDSGEDFLPLLLRWIGFPDDLPNLAILRPPGGNTRTDSVDRCYYQQRIKGVLPDRY